MRSALLAFGALAIGLPCGCAAETGARVVERHGFPRCIELSNAGTTVVLEPNCGGRVLAYARRGANVLYVGPVHERERVVHRRLVPLRLPLPRGQDGGPRPGAPTDRGVVRSLNAQSPPLAHARGLIPITFENCREK